MTRLCSSALFLGRRTFVLPTLYLKECKCSSSSHSSSSNSSCSSSSSNSSSSNSSLYFQIILRFINKNIVFCSKVADVSVSSGNDIEIVLEVVHLEGGCP